MTSRLSIVGALKFRGMGNGEWEVGSGKWEVGSGKPKIESGKWKVESGKWKVESVEFKSNFPLSTPHSPLASPLLTSKVALVNRFVGFEFQAVEQRFFGLVNFGPPLDLHVDTVAVGGGDFEDRRFAVLVGQSDFDCGLGKLRR